MSITIVSFDSQNLERTCEANVAGKNSSFNFIACVKSVPFYHVKLISPFLEQGFEKFFDSHMKNYMGKLKIIKWHRFDTD